MDQVELGQPGEVDGSKARKALRSQLGDLASDENLSTGGTTLAAREDPIRIGSRCL